MTNFPSFVLDHLSKTSQHLTITYGCDRNSMGQVIDHKLYQPWNPCLLKWPFQQNPQLSLLPVPVTITWNQYQNLQVTTDSSTNRPLLKTSLGGSNFLDKFPANLKKVPAYHNDYKKTNLIHFWNHSHTYTLHFCLFRVLYYFVKTKS